MHYDAFLFVQDIRKKFWLGMLASVDAALIAAARGQVGKGPRAVHPEAAAEFTRFLLGAREYLLSEGRVRPNLDDEQFALLRPLCEHLVSQGRFPHDRLQLFAGLERWSMVPTAGGAEAAPSGPGSPEP